MQIENVNLGTIAVGRKHSFSALIRNDSSFTISIIRLKVQCTSCLTAKTRNDVIKAFDDVLMDVSFTPGSIGVHDKYITIYYMENNIPLEFKFILTATVI